MKLSLNSLLILCSLPFLPISLSAKQIHLKSPADYYRKWPKIDPDLKIFNNLLNILSESDHSKALSIESHEEFCSNKDISIPMWVRIPPQCRDDLCPVIVHYHGGPANQAYSGYHWRAEFFLRFGFIYIEPNIRGSSGFGKNWEDADNQSKRYAALTDIEACAHYIKKRFSRNGIVPKIGILGWSYGGYVSLMGMTRFSGSYDAGYALAAKTDLYSFFKNAPLSFKKDRLQEYGDVDNEPNLFRSLSPITYIDHVKNPISIMLGGLDQKVSLSDADHFIETLRNNGQDASLMIIPSHQHRTEKQSEIAFEHAHIIKFFSTKLKTSTALISQ